MAVKRPLGPRGSLHSGLRKEIVTFRAEIAKHIAKSGFPIFRYLTWTVCSLDYHLDDCDELGAFIETFSRSWPLRWYEARMGISP
jgi:hypothetical protein